MTTLHLRMEDQQNLDLEKSDILDHIEIHLLSSSFNIDNQT